MKTATLVGSGPSCDLFDWSRLEGDLCAVSSGVIFCPEMPMHLFAMDPPHLFAKQVVRDPDGQKHVPDQNQRWKDKPNVRMWYLRTLVAMSRVPSLCTARRMPEAPWL